ncbi:hypothetical protein B0A52_08202 [Exophiala mesophila]|uniref:Uncharacterized protein n=1 Tax=Exophiala mesophila TaxID=212818 RepID=A0A438MY68_EXOME|nr:hypothetical protein B0A52_08202 [Exophiala mesophila]
MRRAELKFVEGVPRDHAHAVRVRREVRSHAARSAAQDHQDESVVANGAKKRRSRKRFPRWTLEIRIDDNQGRNESSSSQSMSPLTPLSGNDLIPASKSPVYHEPFVSVVVDNYLENLAVAIPEVDGDQETCLLKTRWFPMVIHCPLIFQVIVLFSASHYAAFQGDSTMAEAILRLKEYAIRGITQSLKENKGWVGDDLIAASAKMASYEAIYGSESAYHAHMTGVQGMLQLRGGLGSLGLDGLLARLLIFIDTNSAFLLNTRLHLEAASFPRLAPFVLPNPGRFIGAS